jgi:peroxiredoxin
MYGGVEMNEPVAMRYDFDGYGYKYIDSGSGSDWQTRERGEFLYTKPFFSQKPVAMMVKMDGFDKPEFTTTCSSNALKHPNYTALYDHPMRELTQEEIDNIFGISALNTTVTLTTEQCYWIVDEILKKGK